jgi:hypothetical protein
MNGPVGSIHSESRSTSTIHWLSATYHDINESCGAVVQNLPELGVPELPSFLKPPKDFRSATFDVTYLDTGMRVTRGDR